MRNLELRDAIPLPADLKTGSKYDLIANMVHEGGAGEAKRGKGGNPKKGEAEAGSGVYRLHANRKVEDIWYEVQDLRVTDILPQMVALSESYFQVGSEFKRSRTSDTSAVQRGLHVYVVCRVAPPTLCSAPLAAYTQVYELKGAGAELAS